MSCNFLRICIIIVTCEILYILAFIFRFLLFSFIICIMLLNSFTIFCCFKLIFFYKSEVKLLSWRRMECPLPGIAVSFSWTREGRSVRVTGRLVQRLQWANAAPVCCGEVRCVFKQSCLLTGCSMIAPRVLFSDQQNKMDTSGRKEFLPNGVWAFFNSKGEELGQSGATQSKAAAHLFQKEPIEASWALSGMSHWGGQTQDTRGRLCLSVCLGAPQCP